MRESPLLPFTRHASRLRRVRAGGSIAHPPPLLARKAVSSISRACAFARTHVRTHVHVLTRAHTPQVPQYNSQSTDSSFEGTSPSLFLSPFCAGPGGGPIM